MKAAVALICLLCAPGLALAEADSSTGDPVAKSVIGEVLAPSGSDTTQDTVAIEKRRFSVAQRFFSSPDQELRERLAVVEAVQEHQGDRFSDMEWIIGLFGVLITVIVIFFALRIEKAAVAAAVKEVKAEADDVIKKIDRASQEALDHLKYTQLETDKLKGHLIEHLNEVGLMKGLKFPEVGQEIRSEVKDLVSGYIGGNYDQTVVDADKVLRDSPNDQESVLASVIQADALHELKRSEEALAILDNVLELHDASSDPGMLQGVASALISKGAIFGELGRREDEARCYEAVEQRFGESDWPPIQVSVAIALNHMGTMLAETGRFDEAIEASKNVIDRYGASQDPGILRCVALAERILKSARRLKAAIEE